MAKGLVVNVVAGAERHTEVFTRDRVRIGPAEECDLHLTGPDDDAVWLEITRLNGKYRARLLRAGLDCRHNGQPLQENAPLADGDQIAFPQQDVTLQFFPVGGLPAVLPALRGNGMQAIQIQADESLAEARSNQAKAFLREFTLELLREISPLTKGVAVGVLAILLLGGGYLLFSFYRELQRSRAAAETSQVEIKALNDKLKDLEVKLETIGQTTGELMGSASLPYKVRNDYGNGVCLIYGLYYFVDLKTGKPLRYPQGGQQEGDDMRPYVIEGSGPVAEFEAIGTGFHVGEGFILTNRHVVQPWTEEQQKQQLKTLKATAKIKRLIVYFPNRQQPLNLSFRVAAPQEDVAVCHVEGLPSDIPTLPLDYDADSVAVGRIVALMGYPNGPNRLITLLEEPEQQELQRRCGGTQGSTVGCLAEKNLIKPLTTQGTITDKDVKRVVYDARTAEGGSGSPLFGQTGRVIGINFGVFTENEASNFAVPIRYGISLLQKTSWGQSQNNSNANANLANLNANRNTNANLSR
jgi:S1-C subfamily serine protease